MSSLAVKIFTVQIRRREEQFTDKKYQKSEYIRLFHKIMYCFDDNKFIFFQSQSNQKNLFNYKINVPRQNNGFDKAVYNKIIKVN